MNEKATFCPRCHHMHIGICQVSVARPVAAIPAYIEAILDKASVDAAKKIIAADQDKQVDHAAPKFDKKAYQRVLMRKRRAAAKQ